MLQACTKKINFNDKDYRGICDVVFHHIRMIRKNRGFSFYFNMFLSKFIVNSIVQLVSKSARNDFCLIFFLL